MDPDMIRDILFNHNTFQKIKGNPLIRLLVDGLVFEEGDQWAKHRKIMNPAFNLLKLKVRNIEIMILERHNYVWTL